MVFDSRVLIGTVIIMAMTGVGIAWAVLALDPDVAVGVGTFVLAAVTLELALVAFCQMSDARKQALETQRVSLRPLLVPMGSLGLGPFSDMAAFWSMPSQSVEIKNVGSGVATNVRGVILPAIEPSPSTRLVFSRSLPFPVAKGDYVEGLFETGAIVISAGDHIDNVSLYAPKDQNYHVRLTLTYWDTLGSKHASIFDLAKNGAWKQVAILNDISEDLDDLTAESSARMRLGVPAHQVS